MACWVKVCGVGKAPETCGIVGSGVPTRARNWENGTAVGAEMSAFLMDFDTVDRGMLVGSSVGLLRTRKLGGEGSSLVADLEILQPIVGESRC